MEQSDPTRSSPVTSGQDGTTVGDQHDAAGGGASVSHNESEREMLNDLPK
jgi:hypothetical protein